LIHRLIIIILLLYNLSCFICDQKLKNKFLRARIHQTALMHLYLHLHCVIIDNNSAGFQDNDIYYITQHNSGHTRYSWSVTSMIRNNAFQLEGFSVRDKYRIHNMFLPNHASRVFEFNHKPYWTLYSKDGNLLVTASGSKSAFFVLLHIIFI
jgi:hypothetical protein